MTQRQNYTANWSHRAGARHVMENPVYAFASHLTSVSKRLGETLIVTIPVQNTGSKTAQIELRLLNPFTTKLANGPRFTLARGQKAMLSVKWAVSMAHGIGLTNTMYALTVRTLPNGTWDGLERTPFILNIIRE